mmetsp:Transcript_16522/g.47672  ORF Transcript_16522/g.47672 Transcript_16522/m.47672 type:complete len:262 (+) Transcript_16522:681-1466(+)
MAWRQRCGPTQEGHQRFDRPDEGGALGFGAHGEGRTLLKHGAGRHVALEPCHEPRAVRPGVLALPRIDLRHQPRPLALHWRRLVLGPQHCAGCLGADSLGRERRRIGHSDRREKAVRAVREVGERPAARAHRDEADEDGAERVVPAELGPREPAGGGDGALRRGGRGRLGVGRRARVCGRRRGSAGRLGRRLATNGFASDVFLVDLRSEQLREPVGVDAADRGEVLGGLGAVDQVGLALAERGEGLPLVDAREGRSHGGEE